mmetsp:Transcript_17845/g.27607  ORF Transcript_17845/g.27607 Transcript_17845/m.27607 type:complete len:242 (-) Transcript_17845:157-882(-)
MVILYYLFVSRAPELLQFLSNLLLNSYGPIALYFPLVVQGADNVVDLIGEVFDLLLDNRLEPYFLLFYLLITLFFFLLLLLVVFFFNPLKQRTTLFHELLHFRILMAPLLVASLSVEVHLHNPLLYCLLPLVLHELKLLHSDFMAEASPFAVFCFKLTDYGLPLLSSVQALSIVEPHDFLIYQLNKVSVLFGVRDIEVLALHAHIGVTEFIQGLRLLPRDDLYKGVDLWRGPLPRFLDLFG